MIEYGLMVALTAVVVAVTVGPLGAVIADVTAELQIVTASGLLRRRLGHHRHAQSAAQRRGPDMARQTRWRPPHTMTGRSSWSAGY